MPISNTIHLLEDARTLQWWVALYFVPLLILYLTSAEAYCKLKFPPQGQSKKVIVSSRKSKKVKKLAVIGLPVFVDCEQWKEYPIVRIHDHFQQHPWVIAALFRLPYASPARA